MYESFKISEQQSVDKNLVRTIDTIQNKKDIGTINYPQNTSQKTRRVINMNPTTNE